ncbi:MAG TPA: hypothetical protein QF762_05900 [Acidimicrobiales bacterium]|nr:hypothetical protein [Acidimicrobiales bacterium]|tara:strand:- start:5629 stop:5913 length:285 start_codon:yes stop_codon:yes gene_type:complete
MSKKNTTEDTVGLFQQYFRQEMIDPLRTIGRFLAYGITGSILIGTGLVLLAVGTLRGLQATEVFEKWWSWAPYCISAAALIAVSFLALHQIKEK